jgi:exosome complex RNA-binding protein Rrp4
MKKDKVEETTSENSAPKLMTGFAVLVGLDGSVYVERNTQALSLPLEREATLIEVRRYCSEILMDIQAQSAAEYTVLRLAQAQKPKE